MFRPKRLEINNYGLGSKMVSTPPTVLLGPGSSSSRYEMSIQPDTTGTQELAAAPGPDTGEDQAVGRVGSFGLDGFSDRYTEGTEGTFNSPLTRNTGYHLARFEFRFDLAKFLVIWFSGIARNLAILIVS